MNAGFIFLHHILSGAADSVPSGPSDGAGPAIFVCREGSTAKVGSGRNPAAIDRVNLGVILRFFVGATPVVARDSALHRVGIGTRGSRGPDIQTTPGYRDSSHAWNINTSQS